jgi:hypothetical protein
VSASSFTATLSTSELNELQISFYPNPVGDLINLKLPNAMGETSGQIIDMNGKVIKNFGRVEILNTIDVKFLKTGIYFLSIENETGRSMLKFVKI